jgi:EAL domain-containing protein (putative c-di-GMP-specific phosphodiesterase class I)/CheY-like chemotaxis protein
MDATEPAAASNSVAVAAHRAHILLVEDEPALLHMLTRALDRVGFEVDTARNGPAAAALIDGNRYDVIVSDIGLPGMDGIQLLHAVRQRDLDVPVVLMTGNPSVDTAMGAIEHGVLRYLVKPFEISKFREVVLKAVRLHELARLKRQALDLAEKTGKEIKNRAALGSTLDGSLGSLWMAYQPIVSWKDRRPVAYEALLRSKEPTLQNPVSILGAAESLGRLPEVGRALRARVAKDCAGCPVGEIFVNIHPLDLSDDSLFSSVAPLSAVAERIVLEVTEREALDDVPAAGERIAALREMGFRIALDDLGAGYAGLTSFAQLEPDFVKFDMSLVRGLDKNEKKKKLIQSMTALFKELGLRTIAEGVETASERDALTSIGCDLLQGYLFAKPANPFPGVAW